MSFREKADSLKAYFAMAMVVLLEAYALSLGIDGALLASVIAVLSGLGGYEYARRTS